MRSDRRPLIWIAFHLVRVVILFYPVVFTLGVFVGLTSLPFCWDAEDACIPIFQMLIGIPVTIWLTRRFYLGWYRRLWERLFGPVIESRVGS